MSFIIGTADINFIGVVITNENVTLVDKERSSNYTAKLVEFRADAAIVSESSAILMQIWSWCTKLERKELKLF